MTTGGEPMAAKFEIDYELVAKLAEIQCTQEEIARVLGCSTKTLQRDEEYSLIYKKAAESGRTSLRRYQWKSAEKGNVTMQIWLGKQFLGQKDIITYNNLDDTEDDPLTSAIKNQFHKPKNEDDEE